ncbi:MAG: hypothetical protein KF777_01435 [Planctomycetaceae bacterium]|nr:hypothetical protein [Planctomycetaceae bacterium]
MSTAQDVFLRQPRTAREVAWCALEAWRTNGARLRDVLPTLMTDARLSRADRAFANELAVSTLRRQATLDALLAHCVSRPREQVEPELWQVLRLGACQIALLTGVPPHAAVNETVALAKRCRERWAGFVNGILRRLLRLADASPKTTDGPSADAFLLGFHEFRRVAEPVFPRPDDNPSAYWAESGSIPEWLIARWLKRWETKTLQQVIAASNRPASVTIRANQVHIPRDSLIAVLEHHDIACSATTHPDGIRLHQSGRIEDLPGFDEGWFSVQDETAMEAARRLSPRPGERFWDVCAAPGTKATHLAELLDNQGQVIATDVRPDRLKRIHENVKRLSLPCLKVQSLSLDWHDAPEGPFDGILLDVPCSNTGVLAKRPEVRWRLTPGDIEELPRLQANLLDLAISRLKPDGRLLYSTCSLEPEENEGIVAAALSRHAGLGCQEQSLTLPDSDRDGGFQALLAWQNSGR